MNEQPVNAQQAVAVRQIIWRDIFPWLILMRCFRLAIAPGPLMLATAAVAFTSLGWWESAFILPKVERERVRQPLLLTEAVATHPHSNMTQFPQHTFGTNLPLEGAATVPFKRLAEPALEIFSADTSFRHVVYYGIGFLISAAVWGFFGGVISRQALVQLGCDTTYDWLDAARFVAPRYLQYALAPLAPLFALCVMGLLVVPLGLLMRLEIGVFLAGLLWIFVIGLGLVAAWLIVGLFFGWPLMYGVIGSKRDGDALQAFSDSFSYVYGKPLHYLWYALVAIFLGGLGLLIVHLFATSAIEFGWWSASWGAGATRIALIRQQVTEVRLGANVEAPIMREGGVELVALVLSLVEVVERAAAYSYFFVASTAIFLLMRLAVDDKEMDEIQLEEDEEILETARKGMLSDETPAAQQPPPPGATVAFDTAAPPTPPPAVNTTEITTPPAESTPPPQIPPAEPPPSSDSADR
ncbi:hypothetical protein [Anatilimnocola floriformis]|uniref:hypothetical protein n=1 Tax=Anatilimnocola floriformis TaxID=2948575 RepID=UPI0020C2D454|nr:hypothetical protein [Anatilimnocola floriformis]